MCVLTSTPIKIRLPTHFKNIPISRLSVPRTVFQVFSIGNVEKAASGVLAILPTFGLTDLPLFAAFALTYSMYAPRVKMASALLGGPFGKTQGMLF